MDPCIYNLRCHSDPTLEFLDRARRQLRLRTLPTWHDDLLRSIPRRISCVVADSSLLGLSQAPRNARQGRLDRTLRRESQGPSPGAHRPSLCRLSVRCFHLQFRFITQTPTLFSATVTDRTPTTPLVHLLEASSASTPLRNLNPGASQHNQYPYSISKHLGVSRSH